MSRAGGWRLALALALGLAISGLPLVAAAQAPLGGPSTPVDVIFGVDDDVIQILCNASPADDQLSGDPGAVDSANVVLAFSLPFVTDTTDASFLGSTQAAANGSFGAFSIGDNQQDPSTGFVYIYAMDSGGNVSGSLALYNDIDGSGVDAPWSIGGELPMDLITQNEIYADGDSIVVTASFNDTVFAGGNVVTSVDPSASVIADFSQIDTGAGSDNVVFDNWGADGIDNDGDWQESDSLASLDPGDADNLSDDLGVDGIPATSDQGEGDGLPTPGEYFCDVGGPGGVGAGNGTYDAGEPFTDTDGDNLHDAGEPDIDFNDVGTGSDDLGERGIYQARWDIVEATSVTDEGQGNFNEIQNLPVVMTATDCCQNVTVMNGSDPENRFLLELDNLAPSVSEPADLELEPGFQTDSATDNEMEDQIGADCFVVGGFVDFTFETPSDADVDYVVVQISVNGGAWQDMSYDPVGDANGDGYPGAAGIDDDRDGAADSSDTEVFAAVTNSSNDGVDNDNDGAVDEESDGLDNDGAGGADDAGEEEAYDPASDDNEDGIVDGVARANPFFSGGNVAGNPYNRAYNPQPHVLQVDSLNGTSDTFDWYDNSPLRYTKEGAQNLDVTYIRNLYGVTDADSFSLRGVAVDNAGGPLYGPGTDANDFDNIPAGPLGDNFISVILADQSGFSADESPANTYSGNADSDYAVSFCMKPSDTQESASTLLDDLGDEICDAEENEQGGDPDLPGDETSQIPAIAADYTLNATASDDAAEVSFWVSVGDSGDWRLLGTDTSGPPWSMTWVPGLVDNDPADRTNRYWLTTTSEDQGGNAEDLDRNDDGALDTLDAQVDVVVTDCVAPIANVTRVENGVGLIDDDLTDGVVVPPSNAINIWVDDFSPGAGYVGYSDRDEIQMFTDGSDDQPGFAFVDDDNDGVTDERDFGFDGAPGTSDDEWGAAGSDDVNSQGYASPNGGYWTPRVGLGLDRAPGNVTDNEDDDAYTDEPEYGDDETPGTSDDEYLQTVDVNVPHDDYFTNDVIRVDFQYRSAAGGGPWLPIPGSSSLTGTIVNGNVSDLLAPLKITWDVTTLEPGNYDIRAQAFDLEGNTNDGTAFITTVHIDNAGGLRAYITPPVQELSDPAGVYNLYAHTYIHDNYVDHVEFQFSTDMGATWSFIAVDDNDDATADPGGDILMRAGTTPFQSANDPDVVGGTGIAFPPGHSYWDADADGYSALDPIVDDNNNNQIYDGGDVVIVGDPSEIPGGSPLTDLNPDGAFDAGVDLYYVDTGGTAAFEAEDWIYQDNVGEAQDSGFDLWCIAWDARGLDGEIWVRAVATNELGVTDSDGIPYETLTIDVDAPCAEITGIALEDGTFQAPNYDSLDVFNDNDFIQIRATVADTDVEQVEFQWSVDGGASWLSTASYFDVNEDNDFYSDIDGVPGFSSGDEIFFDADGNFQYSAGDVVLRDDGTTETPIGWQLIPLVGEDPSGSGDEDDDGQFDEDDSDATDFAVSNGGFFDVFLNLVEATADGYFQTDTQVLFRAIASDAIGNTCPNPQFFKAIIHERGECVVDAIVATTQDGDTLDIFNSVSDGDEVDQVDASVTTVNVFATADAQAAITQLCLFYRRDPNAYPDQTIFNNPWVAAGACDATYPYNISWDMAGLEDGCYQFYVQCTDPSGTPSSPPANPYGIRKLTVTAEVTAFVSSSGDTLADGSSVLSGDELTVFAELSDPAATDGATVTFLYAERITGESVNLSLAAPYVYNLALSAVLDSDPNGESTVMVTKNSVPLTYYTESEFDTLTSTAGDCFTVRDGGDQIEINGAPSGSDTVLVSYNVTGYSELGFGDDDAPYSVELGFLTGGIPGPSYSEVNAIDVIAVVSYNFFTPIFGDEGACLFEPELSEGHFLQLLDAEGPCATIYGLERDRFDESYPYDFNQPGNPMCLYGDKQETGLAAKEVDVFVVTDEPFSGIDSVYAFVDGEAAQFNFAPYSQSDSDAANDSICIPVTMYVEDYQCIAGLITGKGFGGFSGPVLDPEDVESVTLRYVGEEDGVEREFTMYDDGVNGGDKTANDGCYTASPCLGLGQTYDYFFDIEIVSGEYSVQPVADARNNSGNPLFGESSIVVPDEFWYYHFDQAVAGDDVLDDGVHSIIVWAVDEEGNRRSDKSCDGDVTQFLIDTIAPVIAMTDVTPEVLNPNSEDCNVVTFSAMIPPNPASIPALGVDMVQFQFSPDNGEHWLVLGTDESSDDGWQITSTWSSLANGLADPSEDGVDNDGDGWTDEDELVGDGVSEETATYLFRACATDECGNTSLSTPLPFTVDVQPPDCEIVSPAEGSLFVYGDDITICAVSPDAGTLSRVLFQYMDRSGEWIDIDWTPQDNSDDPGVPPPFANADTVCVTWDSDILDLEGENPFVWIRCCVSDNACNEACDNDPVLVQFYDNTAPGAWLTTFNSGCDEVNVFDPRLAIQGDEVEVCGIAIDPSGVENIAKVTVERDDNGTWTELFTVFGPFDFVNATTGSWCTTFDATPYCGQTLTLRSTATDVNGNTTNTEYTYQVPVDCTAPAIAYNADGFVFIDSSAVYQNDGVIDQSSLVVVPNPFTGDVIFRVTTDDPDVQSMVVQFRDIDPTTPGDWENLEICGDNLGDCDDLLLEYQPNVEVPGGGFFWFGIAPDWATNSPLPEDQYEFRVLATDYACNDNAASTEFVAATVDTSDPFCVFFGNNAAGEIPGQVAAGDTVRLVIAASDSLTDVVAFWFEWSFDGVNWETIGSDDEPDGDKIDTENAIWTSDFLWTTPDFIVRDKDAIVRAHVIDAAGNEGTCEQTIRIEDVTPPAGTRIWDISLADGGCIQPPDVTPTTVIGGTTINSVVNITAQSALGDSGIAEVTFELSADDGVTWTVIGVSQDGEDGAWTIVFDPNQLDGSGNVAFPDGTYLLRAWATDLEGNTEVLTDTTPMRVPLTIDTTAPVVKMNVVGTTDFDGTPQVCDTSVERGPVVNVSARTIVSVGDMTETTDEDAIVSWYIANASDELNVGDAWTLMTPENGFFFEPLNDEDNPDESRPYSFYWNTGLTEPPLQVGSSYAIVAVGEDLVCNVGDVVQAWQDGLGTCFTITDTTASCATIVELFRDQEPEFQQWPAYSRVNRIDELSAAILSGDTDVERVDFYYRAQGSSTWILADGDLSEAGDLFWTLDDWTSDNLAEGIYEFAANAIDDVGNADFDPSDPNNAPCSITPLVIDRTAPVISNETAPADSQTCADARYIYDSDGDPTMDVWVTLDSTYVASNGNDVFFENPQESGEGMEFEWKYSSEPDVDGNWTSDGFDDILFDAATGRFSTTFDVTEPADDIVDFRVTMVDSAGNTNPVVFATWVVLPTSDPEAAITAIVNLTTDTTIDPNNQGQDTDISAGDPIRIWVTARSGSVWVPSWASCGVDSVFYEVARGFEQGDEPDDDEFQPLTLGTAVQDTLPAGAFFADWNTTGLSPGYYWIRAFAVDCCGNRGDTQAVELRVKSISMPKAAVVCFDADLINDVTGTTLMHVYAQEWCDQIVDQVIFEYRDLNGPGSTDWIGFGIVESTSAESLWVADIGINTTASFQVGDEIEFRATAIKFVDDDDDGDRTIDLIDTNPAVTRVTLQRGELSGYVFEPIRTSPELVNFVSVALVPEAEGDDPEWRAEVRTSSNGVIPWANVVFEDVYTDQGNTEASFRMYRSVDDPTLWRGGADAFFSELCVGGDLTFCTAALDTVTNLVDIDELVNRAFRVTNATGTNGTVSLNRTVDDTTRSVMVNIPPGNDVDGALLVSPAIDPVIAVSGQQNLFLRPLANSCWDLRLINCLSDGLGQGCGILDTSFPATVKIEYSEEDFPLDFPAGQWESQLIPAYYDSDGRQQFRVDGITIVGVDTLANTVTFRTEDLCNNNLYCLIIPTTDLFAFNVIPVCNGYVNDHPIIQGTLRDIFTDAENDEDSSSDIQLDNIRIWIDDRIVAWTDDIQDSDNNGSCDATPDPNEEFEDFEEHVIGNGCFDVDGIGNDDSDEASAANFKYIHSTLDEDKLDPGEHILRITFPGIQNEETVIFERRFVLNVDATPPRAWINGGFVGSPILVNGGGYVDAAEPAITAFLLDRESGVMVKPRQADPILNVLFANLIGEPEIEIEFPAIPGDPDVIIRFRNGIEIPIQDVGLKMDVWLVDPAADEDTDGDDIFLDRLLIQTATADMLQYTPPLWSGVVDSGGYYTPADTLIARFPLVANLSAYDGREIEVVLYTAKITQIIPDWDIDDILDALDGDDDDDDGDESDSLALAKTGTAATTADDDEVFTTYLFGPTDCVGNVGSAYTAARFIVDATPPGVEFLSPICNSSVTPGASLTIAFQVDNDGAGIDESTLEVDVSGPEEFSFDEEDITVADGVVTIPVEPAGDAFAVGTYTITVTGVDDIGREFTSVCTFNVQSAVLTVFGGGVFPNPFDPSTGNATIRWDQSQPGTVTIEVYDFSGDFVGRILENQLVLPQMARDGIEWGGTNDQGEFLADGGYLAHIIVTGGGRVQTTDVKIAIDRQD